ncbi:MAG: DUF2953 domain-containing protein [Clostridiales bacterium]|jgi:hypothetical protein|nr:DUF2953 domain-containing protein [Clostridiales bacterium]
MMVFQILIYLMLLLISILMLMLVMPIYYGFSGTKEDMLIIGVEVFGPLKWMHLVFKTEDMTTSELNLRFLGIPIRFRGRKKHFPDGEKTKMDIKNVKNHKKRQEAGRELFMKIFELSTMILKHIKPRRFELKGRYGFNDPYHTGILCALVNSIIPNGKKNNVDLIPVFDEEIIEGNFILEGYIVPGYLFYLFIKIIVLPKIKKASRLFFRGMVNKIYPYPVNK